MQQDERKVKISHCLRNLKKSEGTHNREPNQRTLQAGARSPNVLEKMEWERTEPCKGTLGADKERRKGQGVCSSG